MKISSMQEYGLRCILCLAAHKCDTPMTVREIAEKECLTTDYVEKILVTLRHAGLVKSIRGVNGGYVLEMPSKEISVAKVLESLGPVELGKSICKRFSGETDKCVHQGNCSIRPVWGVLNQFIYKFLSRLNLENLNQSENELKAEIERQCI